MITSNELVQYYLKYHRAMNDGDVHRAERIVKVFERKRRAYQKSQKQDQPLVLSNIHTNDSDCSSNTSASDTSSDRSRDLSADFPSRPQTASSDTPSATFCTSPLIMSTTSLTIQESYTSPEAPTSEPSRRRKRIEDPDCDDSGEFKPDPETGLGDRQDDLEDDASVKRAPTKRRRLSTPAASTKSQTPKKSRKRTKKSLPAVTAANIWAVDRIIDVSRQWDQQTQRWNETFLVHWVGFGEEERTWEPMENLLGPAAQQMAESALKEYHERTAPAPLPTDGEDLKAA